MSTLKLEERVAASLDASKSRLCGKTRLLRDGQGDVQSTRIMCTVFISCVASLAVAPHSTARCRLVAGLGRSSE